MKRFIITIGLLLCIVAFAQAQQKQVIAVAAVARTQDSETSSRAARAPYYLIFDNHGTLLEVVSNPFHDAVRRAGPKVAELLAEKHVTVVAAGSFGNKIKAALDEEGIHYYESTGPAEKVVQKLLGQKQPKR